MLFTADHDEPRRILQKFIAAEINPFVDEWEEAGQFPSHDLFKKLGRDTPGVVGCARESSVTTVKYERRDAAWVRRREEDREQPCHAVRHQGWLVNTNRAEYREEIRRLSFQ